MSLISKPWTFSAGAVIIASEHNSDFDTIYSEFNGSISNTNIASNAAIAYSKLNLTGNIVNADIKSTAAIVDTKLAQITTAGKVSGAALTSLSSTPSGAGVVPIANLATGTPTGSKFIRDDGSLQIPPSLGNVIFRSGYFPYKSSDLKAFYVASANSITSQTDNQTLYTNFWVSSNNDTYETIFDEEYWKRLSGTTTATVYAWAWGGSGTLNANLQITMYDGSATLTGNASTTGNPTTPQLITFTIDISTLSTSAVTKIKGELKTVSGLSTSFCAAIVILAS